MIALKRSAILARTRSARSNSLARIASPRKIVAHPGPGRTSIKSPATIKEMPIINTIMRRADRGVLRQVDLNCTIAISIAIYVAGVSTRLSAAVEGGSSKRPNRAPISPTGSRSDERAAGRYVSREVPGAPVVLPRQVVEDVRQLRPAHRRICTLEVVEVLDLDGRDGGR